MFNVKRHGPKRLDIAIEGKLGRDDMVTLLDQLVSASVDIDNGLMLYTIADFDFPSFGAIAVEFSRLPELFRLIRRFDRVAVVSDEQWIRTVGEWEGALIPGLHIKAFESATAAEAWLTG